MTNAGLLEFLRSTGALSAVTHLPAEQNGLSVAIADIDNDGRQDVVVGHFSEARLGILYQLAGGGFSAEDIYVGNPSVINGSQTLAAADVTGDGFRDVVLDGQLIRQHAGGGLGPLAVPRADGRTSIAALRAAARR